MFTILSSRLCIFSSEMKSCVYFMSCDEEKDLTSLIEGVTGALPEGEVRPGMMVYPWHIDTKYYEVDVELCCLERETVGDPEAIVAWFDATNKDGLDGDKIKRVMGDAEVRILVCDQCSEEGVPKSQAIAWCLNNKFELVELINPPDSEEESEQLEMDFHETLGMERIIQALHAHVWPDLIPKAACELPPLIETLQDDDSDLSFDYLFSRLSTMKEKAAGMPPDQRKRFAEQVLSAFMDSIYDDSDELSDDSVDDPSYNQL